jgi:hypothetical protein
LPHQIQRMSQLRMRPYSSFRRERQLRKSFPFGLHKNLDGWRCGCDYLKRRRTRTEDTEDRKISDASQFAGFPAAYDPASPPCEIIFAGMLYCQALAVEIASSLHFATTASTSAGAASVGSTNMLVTSVMPMNPKIPPSVLLCKSYPSAPVPGP